MLVSTIDIIIIKKKKLYMTRATFLSLFTTT